MLTSPKDSIYVGAACERAQLVVGQLEALLAGERLELLRRLARADALPLLLGQFLEIHGGLLSVAMAQTRPSAILYATDAYSVPMNVSKASFVL